MKEEFAKVSGVKGRSSVKYIFLAVFAVVFVTAILTANVTGTQFVSATQSESDSTSQELTAAPWSGTYEASGVGGPQDMIGADVKVKVSKPYSVKRKKQNGDTVTLKKKRVTLRGTVWGGSASGEIVSGNSVEVDATANSANFDNVNTGIGNDFSFNMQLHDGAPGTGAGNMTTPGGQYTVGLNYQ